MTEHIQLSEFFQNEYVDFSTYDNVRKIANYIDGQKNASRKILHSIRELNINSFTKVSNLGPKVQDYTQYLHGSLEGSIVNMTADYVGSGNNIAILQGDGNFGSSFIPTPAATRYIFARQNEIIKTIFLKDDTPLLEEQYFEGDKIEPKYYVPTIPMLLVNGNEGMSIGFAQKILPREPADLIKWITNKAENRSQRGEIRPYWKGQTFTVSPGETANQWIVRGSFKRNNTTTITIDSIPVGYNLKQYQNILDRLVDDKVIKDYDDLSDNDVFKFVVKTDRSFGEKTDEQMMKIFKLEKTITENYTCIDENNKIRLFESVEDILEAWWLKRLEFNQKRKDYIISKLKDEMLELGAKRTFIIGVVDGDIELRNRTETQIFKDAVAYSKDIEPYLPKLINLPMRVLTKEEISKLKNKLKEQATLMKEWQKKSVESISLDDVKEVSEAL